MSSLPPVPPAASHRDPGGAAHRDPGGAARRDPGGAAHRDPGGAALGGPGAGIAPGARWDGRRELRADARTAVLLGAGVALAGAPVGLLWWALAPRADFRITAGGPEAIGTPPAELAVADDGVLVLLLVGLGLLAGGLGWLLRRRRGVSVLLALGLGSALAAVVAWRLGEALAPAPTQAELAEVGAVVTTPLSLDALPALATASFAAVLAYVLGAVAERRDDLARPYEPATHRPDPGGPAPAREDGEPVPAGNPTGGPGA